MRETKKNKKYRPNKVKPLVIKQIMRKSSSYWPAQ